MLIIDRYVLRQFIKSFVICWISLTGLYVVVDAFAHLDEFLTLAKQHQRPLLEVIGEFYSYRSLALFDKISAVLAMIAAMFTITWIQRHQELTALMAAGVSRVRAARPVMIAAVVVTLISLGLRELALPSLREHLMGDAREMLADEAQEMRTRVDHETGIILRGQFLMPHERRIHRPNFLLPDGLKDEGMYLSAVDAVYEPRQGDRPAGYRFKGVTAPAAWLKQPTHTLYDKPMILSPVDHGHWLAGDELFVVSNVEFDQLGVNSTWRQYMSTAELIRGMRNPSLDYGADVRVAIHSRITQPLRDVTLLFLGLPLVLRRETKNPYAAIGLCMLLTITFMLVVTACEYLGGVLLIRPSLAAWLPLMIFVPAATALCDRIDR